MARAARDTHFATVRHQSQAAQTSFPELDPGHVGSTGQLQVLSSPFKNT
jgi:hypothetical protein